MKFQYLIFILHCCLLEQLCRFVLIQKQNQSTAPDVSVNHSFLHPQCTFSDLYLIICNAYPFSLSVLSYPGCICSRWMLSLTRWAHRNRVSELVACADTSVQTSGIFTSAAVAHGHCHPLDVSLNSSTFIGGYEKAQITKCKHALPLCDTLNALNVDIMKGRPRPRSRHVPESCLHLHFHPIQWLPLIALKLFLNLQFCGYEAVLNAICSVLFDVEAAQRGAVNLCSWLMWLSKANMVVFNAWCRERGRPVTWPREMERNEGDAVFSTYLMFCLARY